MIKNIFLLLLFVLICQNQKLLAQEKPLFWDDVQVIKKYDGIYNPPSNPILFIGSSSIRLWNLDRTFSKNTVLNRGIGGAETNHIINYADDIIFPYQPKQIVIYVGENDLIVEGTTADSIFSRTKHLFQIIRAKLPEVPIVYFSIKPSPSREVYLNMAVAANEMIKNYIETQSDMTYIDIFYPMLNKQGKPRSELFIDDMLHMNKRGYKIWRRKLKRHLIK